MEKGKSNLLQKLLTRKIIGEITSRYFSSRGFVWDPVTLYTILQEGKNYYCALLGHQLSLNVGDKVEVYTERMKVLAIDDKRTKRPNAKGIEEFGAKTIKWEPIKKYVILEKIEE